MNRDDIIRMAQEASVPMEYSFVADATVWHLHPSFERFANLVAAAAKAEEREACAKVCDERAATAPMGSDEQCEAEDCAKAIRARGQE